MRHVGRCISLILLAAFSFYVAPKELLHELCRHEHTQDVVCTDTCKDHVDKEHHHCDYLQLSSPPLYLSVNNFSFVLSEDISFKKVAGIRQYCFSLSPFLFMGLET